MESVYRFLEKHSHEIMCWSWALGICGLLFIVMLIVDNAWKHAFNLGYEKGVKDTVEELIQ